MNGEPNSFYEEPAFSCLGRSAWRRSTCGFVFPIFVWAGVASEVSGKLASLCKVFGALSYPAYILQAPILRFGEIALRNKHLSSVEFCAAFILEGTVVCGVAWAANRFIDVPVRAWLSGKTRTSEQATTAEASA
jgi:peptidoglycan/LPS O-acetylase OafA/YrhL